MHAVTKDENGIWMVWDEKAGKHIPMSPEEVARLKALGEAAGRMFGTPKAPADSGSE